MAGLTLIEAPVRGITPNPNQPRTVFDEEALAELYKLYERSKEWDKLADICRRQADAAPDDKAAGTRKRKSAAKNPSGKDAAKPEFIGPRGHQEPK